MWLKVTFGPLSPTVIKIVSQARGECVREGHNGDGEESDHGQSLSGWMEVQ